MLATSHRQVGRLGDGDVRRSVAGRGSDVTCGSDQPRAGRGASATHPRTRVGMERIVSHSPKAMKSRRSSHRCPPASACRVVFRCHLKFGGAVPPNQREGIAGQFVRSDLAANQGARHANQ